jgi:hypothetical protein
MSTNEHGPPAKREWPDHTTAAHLKAGPLPHRAKGQGWARRPLKRETRNSKLETRNSKLETKRALRAHDQ